MNKFVKIGTILGGIWGFVNGIFLVLSFLGGIPNNAFQSNSIYTYVFLPYYITGNLFYNAVFEEILSSIVKVIGTGVLLNILFIFIVIAIPTLIGALVALIIGGIAILVNKISSSVRHE
ncbi:MAG: hypothetical protein O8C61_06615 [Candidatus Methanoperedens sp.]|nr:hypothetical protein [Candidatus Methanoperedens sp.]